jgi:hypothetical protein
MGKNLTEKFSLTIGDYYSNLPELEISKIIKIRNFSFDILRKILHKFPKLAKPVRKIFSLIFKGPIRSVTESPKLRRSVFPAEIKYWILFHCGFFGLAALKLRRLSVVKEPSAKLLYRECLAWSLAGQLDAAAETAQRALKKRPDDQKIIRLFMHLHQDFSLVRRGVRLLLDIGTLQTTLLAASLLNNNGAGDEASSILLKFAEHHPEYAESLADVILWDLNSRSKARHAFELALAHKPTNALRVKHILAMSQTSRNLDELSLTRNEILTELQAVAIDDSCKIDTSNYVDTFTARNFVLTDVYLDNLYSILFHGENDLEIMKARASAFYHIFPDLKFIASHINATKHDLNRKIRFGFFTEFTYNEVWNFWGHMLKTLPRDIFHIILFVPSDLPLLHRKDLHKLCDELREYPYFDTIKIVPVQKAYAAEASFSATRGILASCELDILYSNLIGQSPLPQYLAYGRLAKVQMVDGGRMTTTGMPEIDYYLQPEGAFTGEPEKYFSEPLAFIEGQTPFFRAMWELSTKTPRFRLTRKKLKWPAGAVVYLGMQELANCHPEMHDLFAELLKKDARALLVLTNRVGGPILWSNLISNLQIAGVENPAQRIMAAPHCNLQPAGYRRSMVHLADTCLSYRRFGGGTTFYNMLVDGIPQIIWPAESYIGYYCASVYKQIGLDDLLVDNAEDYVNRNIFIANNYKYREELKEIFQMKVKVFYESQVHYDYSGSISRFFQDAVKRAESGLPPAHWHQGRFYDHLSAEQLKDFAHREQSLIRN